MVDSLAAGTRAADIDLAAGTDPGEDIGLAAVDIDPEADTAAVVGTAGFVGIVAAADMVVADIAAAVEIAAVAADIDSDPEQRWELL